MNIRNRYAKVCLFLWILGMCLAVHPIKAQSVIPVPLKMERGADYFFLSEKTKLYTNLEGEEARLWENCLQALPVSLKKGSKKDVRQVLSLLITEKNDRKVTHCPSLPDESLSVQLPEPDYSTECRRYYSCLPLRARAIPSHPLK